MSTDIFQRTLRKAEADDFEAATKDDQIPPVYNLHVCTVNKQYQNTFYYSKRCTQL